MNESQNNKTKAVLQQIENNFTYHPPVGDQVWRYGDLRDAAKTFALLIANLTPPSREQALALTKLEETVMWANAAIARNEPNHQAPTSEVAP